MKRHIRTLGIITIAILFTLACAISTGTANPDPNTVNTQIALAMTQTAMNIVPLVPSATVGVQNQDPNLVNTQVAMAMTQTAMNIVPAQETATATQEDRPPSQAEIEAMIDSSNILVYEDMVSYTEYITYVARALESVGGHHAYVGDAMGTFMDKLDSGTKWDLIIVAAEARDAISGDYWTILKDKVDDGTALVAEVYYLNRISDGKIGPFLRECGVDVQADWWSNGGGNRIDYGMYWVDPSNPVFNTPNRVNRFGAWLTDPAWQFGDIGDFLEVNDNSKAEILASREQGQDSNYGLITSCMDGRVIFQTFSSHNYPTNDMVALWENYIVYTLTNHFLATP